MVALFSSFGAVTKSEMTIDPATGRTKGFCFLEFGSAAEADAAMAMDGFELAGRKVILLIHIFFIIHHMFL